MTLSAPDPRGFVALDPTDPLAILVHESFGDPAEEVWSGVEALDWRQRSTAGTPLAYAERTLVVTSRRLLVLLRDTDAHGEGPGLPGAEVPYERMRAVRARPQGSAGWLELEYRTDDHEWVTLTYAVARAEEAEQVADRLNEYLGRR